MWVGNGLGGGGSIDAVAGEEAEGGCQQAGVVVEDDCQQSHKQAPLEGCLSRLLLSDVSRGLSPVGR